MILINFSLKKNNNYIINKSDLKCVHKNNKTTFMIDKTKYIYGNNLFIKETNEEEIILDFDNKKCIINLKPDNQSLILNLNNVKIKNNKNLVNIEYNIETEDNTLNIISLEYKKNS